jgi:Bacterial Ig domain/L,D-transpeptidase catalytic domain
LKPIHAAGGGAIHDGGRSGARGRHALLTLVLGAMLVLVTACGGGGGGGGGDGKGGGSAGAGKVSDGDKASSQAVVTITPRNNAAQVATDGALRITADKGRLTSVAVTDDKGTKVAGRLSANATSWTPTERLGAGTKYTVDAVAKDTKGRASAKHSTFTTIVPKDHFIGYFTPEEGSTVGVGMEVSLNFNRAITNQKAVQQGIKVTASPSVPVVGHWFGNQRLDFRPEHYWAPGTKVTLSLRLKGVEGSSGVYGTQAKDVHFTVGRNQISTVDAAKHMMTVTRGGKTIKTIPVTTGAPQHTTWDGIMVISERYQVTRMNGDTVGFGGEYDIKDVPHAQRLTTSGTFIHGNYWAAPSTFGSANTSHGCIGIQDQRGGKNPGTAAAWFFSHSLVGDVVQVKNSHDKTVAPDNGLNGWNMPWSQWTAGQ